MNAMDISGPKEVQDRGARMTEQEIDETLDASYPASDPPSWTLGVEAERRSPDDSDR